MFFRRREFSFFITATVTGDNSSRSPQTQIRHSKALSFTPLGRNSSRFVFFSQRTFFSHFRNFFLSSAGLVVLQLRLRGRVGIAWIFERERFRQIWNISGNCPLHRVDAWVSTWSVSRRLPPVANQRLEDSRGTQWVRIGLRFSTFAPFNGSSLPRSVNNKMKRKKRAYNWNHYTDDFANGVGGDRSTCRARYQQSSVDVFAKFIAIDQVRAFQGSFQDVF